MTPSAPVVPTDNRARGGSNAAQTPGMSLVSRPVLLYQMALAPDKITSMLLFLRRLAEELDRRGWNLVVCAQSPPSPAVRELFAAPYIEFDVLDQNQGWSLGAARQLYQVLGRHRPALYIYAFNSVLRPYAWIARLRGVKRIFYNDHSSRPAHYRPRAPRLWKRLIARTITGPVEGSICISRYVQQCELKEGFLPAGSVHHVYNGIDYEGLIETGAGMREQYRREWNIPAEAFVALQVGWLTPAKGVDQLLRAWQLVCSREQDGRRAHLVLVGSTGDREQLRQYQELAGTLGLGAQVTFAGMIPMVAGAYAAADVYCQMSQWQEGFGSVLAEAMALGLPTVATRVGGIPEIIEDGVTGYLLEQDDVEGMAARLMHLLANPAQGRQMGAAGQERARRLFGLEQMVAGYLRCLRLG